MQGKAIHHEVPHLMGVLLAERIAIRVVWVNKTRLIYVSISLQKWTRYNKVLLSTVHRQFKV